jgi:hypothetical protein
MSQEPGPGLHTPWRLVGTSIFDTADVRVAMVGQASRTLDDAKQIGCLMAAAPELLEACKAMVAFMKRQGWLHMDINQADAVIAKAEGQ